MDEVLEFLKKANVYYLATDEGDQPRVRPFGTINKYNDKLYIQTGKIKDVAKQIAANPKAEICAFEDGVWVRIAATLVADDDIEAEKSMLEAYPSLAGRYTPGDGNNVVYALTDATAIFYSMGDEPREVDC